MLVPGLLRGEGLVAALGGFHDRPFRHPTVKKMLQATDDETKLFLAFPLLGPPPHHPRRLEWNAAWVFARNLSAIDPTEATLLHNMFSTNNLVELQEILRAGHLADETRHCSPNTPL